METREEVLEKLRLSEKVFMSLEKLMTRKAGLEEKEGEIRLQAEQIENYDEVKEGVDGLKTTALGIILCLCIFIIWLIGKFLLVSVIGIGVYIACDYFLDYLANIHADERKEERMKIAKKHFDSNIVPVKNEMDILEKEIQEFFISEDWQFVQSYIPEIYVDSDAISYFISAVSNKRADTLKEAINLYEEHLYKMRMEEMQQNQMLAQQATLEAAQEQLAMTREQLAATKEQNAKLATIEKKSVQTAKAAKATAFISAYSAYNTRKMAKK